MKTTVGVLLAAGLALGSGCARPDWIEQTLVTVDVTGTWSGTMTAGLGELRLELEQEGPKVKGSILGGANRGARSTPVGGAIVGTVAGDVFSFTQTNGDLRGELVVSGDEMKGQVTIGGCRSFYAASMRPLPRPQWASDTVRASRLDAGRPDAL